MAAATMHSMGRQDRMSMSSQLLQYALATTGRSHTT